MSPDAFGRQMQEVLTTWKCVVVYVYLFSFDFFDFYLDLEERREAVHYVDRVCAETLHQFFEE